MTDTKKKFVCPRCGVECSLKANLTSHLNNKTLCEGKVSNISREDALKLFQKERKLPSVTCEYCNKTVSNKSLKRHLTICNKKPVDITNIQIDNDVETRIVNRVLEEIKERFNGVIQNNTYQTINNNNTTVFVNLNTFGNEDMTHLTNDFLSHCLMNPTKGITQLIENIHYNKDVPENNNIRFKSNKNNTFEKYYECTWIECDASNTLDELIRKGYRVLSKHYADYYIENPEYYEDDIKRLAIERFRFLADTACQQYCSVKRDIRLLIKNKTAYVVASPDNLLDNVIINDNEQ
jgi:hypothetical protein